MRYKHHSPMQNVNPSDNHSYGVVGKIRESIEPCNCDQWRLLVFATRRPNPDTKIIIFHRKYELNYR